MLRQSSKETTSKLFKRYVWLVDTIYRAGHITLDQISARWANSQLNETNEELPDRTFYNHRKAIQEMFEIDIKCDRSNSYCFYIENSQEMERGGIRQWLVNTFAVNNLINESHRLKDRIVFEYIPSGQRFLTTLIEAMRDNRSVAITYQSFSHDAAHTFQVDPYCVKIFRQRWYLAAHNDYSHDIRIYALDRILDLSTTDNRFTIDEDFSPQDHFVHSYGVSSYCDAAIVKIRVANATHKDRYIESLPLHHSQKIVERTDSHTVFEYFVRPTYDFYQELLSHGSEIEVISPAYVRQEIVRIVGEQIKIYNINS